MEITKAHSQDKDVGFKESADIAVSRFEACIVLLGTGDPGPRHCSIVDIDGMVSGIVDMQEFLQPTRVYYTFLADRGRGAIAQEPKKQCFLVL